MLLQIDLELALRRTDPLRRRPSSAAAEDLHATGAAAALTTENAVDGTPVYLYALLHPRAVRIKVPAMKQQQHHNPRNRRDRVFGSGGGEDIQPSGDVRNASSVTVHAGGPVLKIFPASALKSTRPSSSSSLLLVLTPKEMLCLYTGST